MSLHITLTPLLAIATDKYNWMLLEGSSQTAVRFADTLPMLIKVCQDKLIGVDLGVLAPYLECMSRLEKSVEQLFADLPTNYNIPADVRLRLGQFELYADWRYSKGLPVAVREYKLCHVVHKGARTKSGNEIADTWSVGKRAVLGFAVDRKKSVGERSETFWGYCKTMRGAVDRFILLTLRINNNLDDASEEIHYAIVEIRRHGGIAVNKTAWDVGTESLRSLQDRRQTK